MESWMSIMFLSFVLQIWRSFALIDESFPANKLAKIKPVGAPIAKKFIPLTELPPPYQLHLPQDMRRRMGNPEDCTEKTIKEVVDGGHVAIEGDYYEERFLKTVATVPYPDHIDRLHFQVTTQVPYLTVGPIDGIGYHPTTYQQNECEKIYEDFMAEQYSDETRDLSEESLEMARMPLYPPFGTNKRIDSDQEDRMYADDVF